jgi:hypothetical protein
MPILGVTRALEFGLKLFNGVALPVADDLGAGEYLRGVVEDLALHLTVDDAVVAYVVVGEEAEEGEGEDDEGGDRDLDDGVAEVEVGFTLLSRFLRLLR